MVSAPQRLDGKVALISGAARGQGLAIARLFHEHGCRVLLGDILEEQGTEASRSIGEGALFVKLDVSTEADWSRAVQLAVSSFGRLDILVNNAGMIHYHPLADTPTADFLRQFEIDQLGVFFGMRAAYPILKKADGGSIINTASTAGLLGLPTMGAYGAAKQAVCAMTRIAASEWGRDGIRVNTIIPGAIRTAMLTDYAGNEALEPIAASAALNRIGEPEDIANLALFLASDESSFCTGGDFFCDGGMHMMR